MHRHHSGRCVEVFIVDLVHVAAVHRIGEIGAEALDVEQIGSLANLLVGGEADADLAVGQIFRKDTLGHGHDLGNARLVVGPQQGGAVGGDERLPLHLGQEGEIGHMHGGAAARQRHVAAVVVLMENRFDVVTGSVIGGVHMSDEAQGMGGLVTRGGRDHAVNIAVLVHADVGDAQRLHFLRQTVGQVKLTRRGGMAGAGGIRGGMDPHIL